MKQLFDDVSIHCSQLVTRAYSTSFSVGILCLQRDLRDPIHAIYGFVRLADEIVDSFHDYDKALLLSRFRDDCYRSIDERISLNPILNSFQATVNGFGIDRSLIDQFLKSMEMDLTHKTYDHSQCEEYILGSAEVVGLMCLQVFLKGDEERYEKLKPHAMSLGAAFQKVNFLRDLNADYFDLGRSYFPGVDLSRFDQASKKKVEDSIAEDFKHGFAGIRQLPRSSRFGVYVAYVYYLALFGKIRNTPSQEVMRTRIRIRTRQKATLLAYSYIKHQFN
ncbi:MAG: phytoene/squalene synthase family protein, partial [Bacteroidota bacterium]|nr:phytoene/squalene synthase family protein [Bacteroidota bacterium]